MRSLPTFAIFSLLILNSITGSSQTFTCSSSDSINTGLLFCLPFNGNANDESSNGYNGTVSGAVLTLDRFGRTGKAYDFNGTSDHIDLVKKLPDSSNLTMSIWVKPTGNATANGFIFFDGDANCGNDFGMAYNNNNLLFIAAKSGATLNGITNTNHKATVSSSLFSTWYHIVWTMSLTTSKLYINGSLSKTISNSGSNVGYHYYPTIGSMYDGNTAPCGSPRSSYFKGGIDDIRLYSRILSDAEILKLYDHNPYTSIEEQVNGVSEQMNIFPNPTSGRINLHLTEKNNLTPLTAELFDLTGKKIHTITIYNPGCEISLDYTGITAGLYYLTIYSENTLIRKPLSIVK